jgi:uncharacterized protein YggE
MKKVWNAIKTPLLTAVFVLLGLMLYHQFSYVLPFGHSPNKNALFTADGTAEASYVPDTALLYLGVNKTAATQEEAKNEANKVINQITADLKKLGIAEKDIKTTNFSVNENYNYEVMPLEATEPAVTGDKMTILPRNPKARGYIASANLEVRVKPLDRAEQAIDAATKAGATQVGTSQMVLDEAKQKELEKQARLEAIKNAKEKAKEISDAAGIRLGRVVSVQESGGGGVRPYMMMKSMDTTAAAEAVPTQLNPGENKVSVSVTLSFETY